MLNLTRRLLAVAWLLSLGGCLASQGQLDSLKRLSLYERETALSRLENEYASEPTDWRAYFVGELRAEVSDFPGMNTWFDRSLRLSDRFEVHIANRRGNLWSRFASQGDSLFAARDYEAATAAYDQALAVDPTATETALRRREARVLAAGPTFDDIVALRTAGAGGAIYAWLEGELTQPSSRRSVVMQDIASVASTGRIHADASLLMAELHRDRGELPQMVQWYDRAVRAGHPDSAGMARIRAFWGREYTNRANACFRAADVTGAIARLDTVEILTPDVATARRMRAAMVSIQSDFTPETLDRVLADENPDLDWLAVVLQRLYTQRRWVDVRRVADRMLEIAPDRLDARLARHQAQLAFSDREGAYADLIYLEENAPGDPLVTYNLGVLALQTGRNREAATFFVLAQERGIDWRQTTINLAVAAFLEGDFLQMKRLTRELTETSATDPEAWRLRAIAARMTLDDELADECQRRLEELQ